MTQKAVITGTSEGFAITDIQPGEAVTITDEKVTFTPPPGGPGGPGPETFDLPAEGESISSAASIAAASEGEGDA